VHKHIAWRLWIRYRHKINYYTAIDCLFCIIDLVKLLYWFSIQCFFLCSYFRPIWIASAAVLVNLVDPCCKFKLLYLHIRTCIYIQRWYTQMTQAHSGLYLHLVLKCLKGEFLAIKFEKAWEKDINNPKMFSENHNQASAFTIAFCKLVYCCKIHPSKISNYM